MGWARGSRCWVATVLVLVACGGGVEGPGEQVTLAAQEQSLRREDGGKVHWARRSTGAGYETVTDVAVDRDGHSVLIGSYDGTPSFGGHVLPEPPGDSSQFIVKYSKDGRVLWARAFDGHLSSVAVDSQRRINLVGSYASPPIPPGPFIAQLSPSGELLWSRSISPVGFGNFANGPALAVDSDDNILLAGSMLGTLDFGGGPRAVPEVSPFLAKYTRGGRYLWDRVFPVVPGGFFNDVDTDSSGNVFVVGTMSGPVDLGGGTLTPPAGATAPVVAKFSSKGAHRWSKMPRTDSGSLMLHGLAVQGNRLVVVGRLDGTMRFGDVVFAAGGGVMLAYSLPGAERWYRTLSTGFLVDAAADRQGGLSVAGFAFGEPGSDIDTGSLPAGLAGYLFAARFDADDGDRRWVRAFGWAAPSVAWPSLAVSRQGDTVVGGSFTSPVYLGTETFEPTVPGEYDAFLLRLKP